MHVFCCWVSAGLNSASMQYLWHSLNKSWGKAKDWSDYLYLRGFSAQLDIIIFII